ncbi:transposase, partial [Streptomyces inhibens]|uniref:transposase n=1 Tax=Streptomyces inhibens TaxID=2293571 RepID=UPI001C6DF762
MPSCDCLAHLYGNAADQPDRRRCSPSDMTDAEWAVVREALPVPAWLEGRGGRPEGYCHRQLIDAVFYLVDNGIKWRAMPIDFPVWDRVYAFFRRWREQNLLIELHDRLRGKADGAYSGALKELARRSWQLLLQIVKRTDDTRDFKVLPRRWCVERTFAWPLRTR